jgi:hypothetical protein
MPIKGLINRGIMIQKRQPKLYIALAAILLASGILIFSVLSDALAKDHSWLLMLFFAALIAAWFAMEWMVATELQGQRSWALLLDKKRLVRFGLIAIGGPLAISQALPLFDPGPVTKKDLVTKNDIREAVVQGVKQGSQESVSRIEKKIVGLWGEPGCKIAYRFSLLPPKGMQIIWERRPTGEAAWRATGTIISAKGDVIESRGETPKSERGKAATFTYVETGALERLTWRDAANDVALELERCI